MEGLAPPPHQLAKGGKASVSCAVRPRPSRQYGKHESEATYDKSQMNFLWNPPVGSGHWCINCNSKILCYFKGTVLPVLGSLGVIRFLYFFWLCLKIMVLGTMSEISGLYDENCACGTHLKFMGRLHTPLETGICLPGTELLQSPFRMEFALGSRSRQYRRSLRHHRKFLLSYHLSLWRCCDLWGDRRSLMRRCRSLRDLLNSLFFILG